LSLSFERYANRLDWSSKLGSFWTRFEKGYRVWENGDFRLV